MNNTIATSWILTLIICIIAGVICGIVAIIVSARKKSKTQSQQQQNILQQQQFKPLQQEKQTERVRIYQRKNLLTKNEYVFYKKLKEFAEKYNLHILSKIRVADIVEPKSNTNRSEWYSDFGKIKSKHVDFALANKDNLYILCLIELDDNSHNKPDRTERDKFIDKIYQSVNIPIIHTKYFNEQTETQLRNVLGLSSEPPRAESQVPSANV